MIVKNAVKKMQKIGVVQQSGSSAWVEYNGHIISIIANGGWDENHSVATIRTRHKNDRDDMQSDYSAGVFCDSLAQAIAISK